MANIYGELTYTQQFPNVKNKVNNEISYFKDIYCFNVRIEPVVVDGKTQTGKANVHIQFTSAGSYDWWVGSSLCKITMYQNGKETDSNKGIGGMKHCNMPGKGDQGVLSSPSTLFYEGLSISKNDTFRFTVDCRSAPLISGKWYPGFLDTGTLTVDRLFPNIPLISPPKIERLVNNNKYNNPATGIQNYVSAAETSVSLKWQLVKGSDAATIKWVRYRKSGGSWGAWAKYTTDLYSHKITGLTAGTSYEFQVCNENEAGYDEKYYLNITIRTRHKKPVLSLALDSVDLETLTFNWTSDKKLKSTQYKIDDGEWVNLGQTGTKGTFTAKWFNPKTKHTIYFKGTSTNELDALVGDQKSASGTTYDKAHITAIDRTIFGLSITLTINSESKKRMSVEILTSGFGRSNSFVKEITKGANNTFTYTWTPSQAELDKMYKCYAQPSQIPISFIITTHGDWKDWVDTPDDRQLVLTGIAKTAHIGVNNLPRRAQVFIGVNDKPLRAVAWVGVKNVAKRCI